eukprot:1156831-Pelagomonas_calceolata.AAC.10
MRTWRVAGSTWLQNLAVRIILVFNRAPSGNKFLGSHQHSEGWCVKSQLSHLYSCKGQHAAAVPPPTVTQALCLEAGVVLLPTSASLIILRSAQCEGEGGGLFGLAGQGVTKIAAGIMSSLNKNAEVKEVWRYYVVRDLLSDVQDTLSQTICAAYIHMRKI